MEIMRHFLRVERQKGPTAGTQQQNLRRGRTFDTFNPKPEENPIEMIIKPLKKT